MPRFLIATRSRTQFNSIRIEPDMYVEVVTRDMTNLLTMNGGSPTSGAFMRISGLLLRKLGF